MPRRAAASESDLHKRILSLKRSRRFIDWRERAQFAGSIDQIRESACRLPAQQRPDLLQALVRTAGAVFARADDSSGLIGDVYRETIRDWGKAWAALESPDQDRLVALVLEESLVEDFGIKWHLIEAFTTALGDGGLRALRTAFEQRRAALPHDSESESQRWNIGYSLCCIADALRDVDGYIAARREAGTLRYAGLDVTRRLLEAHRPQEALDASETLETKYGEKSQLANLRIAALEALGRTDAQQLRWMTFEAELSAELYRDFLDRRSPSARADAVEAALRCADKHRDVYRALAFLTAVGEYVRTENLIIARGDDLDGDVYESLTAAAKSLASKAPLASILLHRKMALAVLARSKSKYYSHAVRDILKAAELSNRVADWRGQSTHAQFLADLHERHARKPAFWALFERRDASGGRTRTPS